MIPRSNEIRSAPLATPSRIRNTMATMANTTCRVAKAYGSSTSRVLDVEKTMKQPATVRIICTVSRTQSMFRLGSAGLALMLPSPESGRRERNAVTCAGSGPSFGDLDGAEPACETGRIRHRLRRCRGDRLRVERVRQHHRIGLRHTRQLHEHALHHGTSALRAVPRLLEIRRDGVGPLRIE